MSEIQKLVTDHIDIWTSAIEKKSATGRGNNKKISLHGIKKLRELILELAVRGKLTLQNPSDDKVDNLIDAIRKKRITLLEANKIRSTKILPVIEDTELPTQLPHSWRWVRLGSVCIIRGGKRVPRGYALLETPTPHIYIRITDMKNGTINECDLRYIDKDIYQQIKRYAINKEDIYVTIAGTIGAVGIIPEKFDGANLTENAAKLVFRGLNKEYFVMALRSGLLQKQFLEEVNKMAQPKLALKRLETALLPLPPLAEQKRIVTKVNELLALCDQLEQESENSITAHQTLVKTLLETLTNSANAEELQENWARIEAHFDTLFTTEHSIDQLKQTILQLAVMGKLVPQDPNDEPASVLLEKIAKEKERLVEDGKIKKQKSLPKISDNEKPFKLPNDWRWCRIGDAAISTDYGLSDKAFVGGVGVPVLAMGHIQSGKVLLDTEKIVTETVESLPELYLKNRDLLYNRTNSAELVGKTGIFLGNDDEYTFASYLIRIRTDKDSLLPEFLNLNMLTPLFRETQIDPLLKQQCGQANVNGTIMRNMIVAIPPKNEMQKIVKKVNELMTLCDTLKEFINKAQNTQIYLADAILEQAVA